MGDDERHGGHAAEVPDPRRWWVLPVLCLSLVLVVVTNSTVYIALPSIARELDASASQLQWVVDAYALVFAALLLPAGFVGDRFGRKGTLQVGLVWFAAASSLGTIATDPVHVIAVRAAMGVGAALVMPSTLSILANIFPPHERSRAIAVWAGCAGVGGVAGPLVAGLLLEHFWWGSVFLVNVPIVAVALLAGALIVPTSRDPHPRRLDPVGALLSAGSLGMVLYGVIEGPERGWADPLTLATLAAGALGAVAFVWWELRTDEPMLELRLFRNPRLSIGAGTIALAFCTTFGLSFLAVQYLQQVLGLSPLAAAVRTVPMGAMLILVAPRTAVLTARFGTGKVVAVGLSFTAAGMLLFSALRPSSPIALLIASFTVLGCGLALTTAPSTNAIMGAVPRHQAGMGSALNDTTREVGGALGIAVIGTLLSTGYRAAIDGGALDGVPTPAAEEARRSIGSAVVAARDLSPDVAGTVLAAARDAFCDGMRLGAWAMAALAAVGAVVTWRGMPAADREVEERRAVRVVRDGDLSGAGR